MANLLLFHLFYIYYNIVFYIVNSVYIIIIVFIFNLQFITLQKNIEIVEKFY